MTRSLTYLFAALLLPLGSCSRSDDNDKPKNPTPIDTPITWEVAGIVSPQSRSLVGPETDDTGNPAADCGWITLEEACTPTAAGGRGKAIGIWADYEYTNGQGYNEVIRNLFEGTRLIYTPKTDGNPYSNWNYENNDLYWLMGGTYRFRAYYPQDFGEKVISSANATTFVIEYPTHELQEDLLLAYNCIDTTNPDNDLSQPVKLYFRHGLAAVRFFVKANFSNSDFLTSCYLQNSPTQDFASSGILVYGSETEEENISWIMGYYPPVTERIYYWKNSGVAFSTDAYGNATPALAYTSEGTTEGTLFTNNDGWILIPPQASSGNLQFCFTTTYGEEAIYKVSIPKITERSIAGDGTTSESTEYLPGKRYTYTISITKTDLDLSLSVADWNLRDSSYNIVF